jgi:hypothetical protein
MKIKKKKFIFIFSLTVPDKTVDKTLQQYKHEGLFCYLINLAVKVFYLTITLLLNF